MVDKDKQQFTLTLSDEGTLKKSPRKEPEKKKTPDVWYYLGTFGNIGFSIAVPIVLGALIGSWIDGKQGSKPTATLIGIIIGFIISILGFINLIRRILRGEFNPK